MQNTRLYRMVNKHIVDCAGHVTYLTPHTDTGRPSERLEFTTESSRFPLITSRYDKAEENDGRFVITLSTTVIRDSPFIFNAGSSTDMYTYSTKTKYPWESTIAWSKGKPSAKKLNAARFGSILHRTVLRSRIPDACVYMTPKRQIVA